MSKQLIAAGSINDPKLIANTNSNQLLGVSEIFYDTVQGEGVYTGHPAVFLRLMGCTLNCSWCDTVEVWRQGDDYSFEQLFEMMEKHNVIARLNLGNHLVITGGSPLKQQIQLAAFIQAFIDRYLFKPLIEIENEAVLPVSPQLEMLIDCWNNSPKLSNSGNSLVSRYKPRVIKQLAKYSNSWFKFVVSDIDDWMEIQCDFLESGLIRRNQIILMPEGQTRDEVMHNRKIAVEIAVAQCVKYSTREHVILWDKKTGV